MTDLSSSQIKRLEKIKKDIIDLMCEKAIHKVDDLSEFESFFTGESK